MRNVADEGTFEEVLADVQSEMIAVSLEFGGAAVSDIYAYGATEAGVFAFDPFFVVDGVVAERHKLPGTDTSVSRQKALTHYGTEQLVRLAKAAREFERPLPTQLKLHYSVATRSLDSSYEYDLQYTNHPTLTISDLVERWQREVQSLLDAA